MKRKSLAVGIILLLVGTCFTPVIAKVIEKSSQSASSGNWLYVGGSGPGNYTKIQGAIDNASSGDTIFVFHGTYYENVVINTTIYLTGENRSTTIIDGKENGHVVVLGVNNIKVTGFTIRNCTKANDYAGIVIFSSNNTISNNTILTNKDNMNDGIIIKGNHNSIIGNTIFNNWDGVYLKDASYNYIAENSIFISQHGICSNGCCRYNTILRNNISSIYISPYSSDWVISNNYLNTSADAIGIYQCKNMTIIGNEINAYTGIKIYHSNFIYITSDIIHCGGEVGIEIWNCSYITIINNTIETASSVGIYYDGMTQGNISCNKISGCDYGMQITSPGKSNLIFNNEFRNNHVGLYTLIEYGTVKITCNNFMNNSRHIIFGQLLPIRRQTPRHPIFDKNYYDNWRGVGPKVLWGRTVIFAIPYFYFPILICIPGVYCDWHPAQEPYDIPRMS